MADELITKPPMITQRKPALAPGDGPNAPFP